MARHLTSRVIVVKPGSKDQYGWGSVLPEFFDASKVSFNNGARGGTSSRSFLRDGWWEKVRPEIKKGDFVIMQFGHNDNGGAKDAKNRGTIKGTGDETEEVVTDPKTGAKETVHSYGWYLNECVVQAKAAGATPIICSLVPRNLWKDGKVGRSTTDYAVWARDIADKNKVAFIPLNSLIADHYDKVGEAYVLDHYFLAADHTHTIEEGARKNAEIVAQALSEIPNTEFKSWLKKSK